MHRNEFLKKLFFCLAYMITVALTNWSNLKWKKWKKMLTERCCKVKDYIGEWSIFGI